MPADVFYFGCESPERLGHYLFHPGMRSVRRDEYPADWPWRQGELDGKYAPHGKMEDVEGRAAIVHHEGWTVMAMWDRSADSRHASNANFVARGELGFEQMVEVAKGHFPEVWERITDRQPVHPA